MDNENVNQLLEALSTAITESNKYAANYGRLLTLIEGWWIRKPNWDTMGTEICSLFMLEASCSPRRGRLWLN